MQLEPRRPGVKMRPFRKTTVVIVVLGICAAACRPQPKAQALQPDELPRPTPIPTPTELPTPTIRTVTESDLPAPNFALLQMLAGVSADRLLSDVEGLASFRSRHPHSVDARYSAEYIFDGFATSGGSLEVSYDEFVLEHLGWVTAQRNVVATLPGEIYPDEVILVGAHYDSRSEEVWDPFSRAPGAGDNATGVAALLEIGRLIAGEKPARTIMLVAFAAEEIGTFGSQHFVERFAEGPGSIQAVLILDILGNPRGEAGRDAVRVFSANPSESPSRHLARYVDAQANLYLPQFDVLVQSAIDRPDRFSDHITFSERGIPAVRVIEALEDQDVQHSENDLPGQVDTEYLQRATQLSLAAVMNLAMGPPPPTSLRQVSNSPDRLEWSPVSGARGYALALRTASGQGITLLMDVGAVTGWGGEALSDPAYSTVSVAAIDAEGWFGPFSPELRLRR